MNETPRTAYELLVAFARERGLLPRKPQKEKGGEGDGGKQPKSV